MKKGNNQTKKERKDCALIEKFKSSNRSVPIKNKSKTQTITKQRKKRKRKLNNNSDIDVYKNLRSIDSSNNKWYICLVSVRERQPISNFYSQEKLGKRCANKTNKTKIYTTQNPIGMIKNLQSNKSNTNSKSTNNNNNNRSIGLELSSSKSNNNNHNNINTVKKIDTSEIVCVIGPVSSESEALKLQQKWIHISRGLQSRAITGSIIAKTYNLDCGINWHAFYRIDEKEIKINEIFDDDGVSLLEFRQINNNNNNNNINGDHVINNQFSHDCEKLD